MERNASENLECAAPQKHYLYVLECVDGSLYTGYTTDVERRVAAHNAGRGAKYTRTRLPVSVLITAEFATKHEAMSAEYHYKRLSRDDKEALVALAMKRPFEEVLSERFPLQEKRQ